MPFWRPIVSKVAGDPRRIGGCRGADHRHL